MRKHILLLLTLTVSLRFVSQTTTPTPNDFDKKYRFGLRVSGQPTQFSTTDKKNRQ